MAYGPSFSSLNQEQQSAVKNFADMLRQRFPEAASTLEAAEQFGSVVLKIRGISAGKLSEIESGMQDVQTQIMLDTGVLLMLLPE